MDIGNLKAFLLKRISKAGFVVKRRRNDFSDDFVNECEVDFDLNLSLIKSSSLIDIFNSFKKSKHKKFPTNLMMRDVLINEERIIRALQK